MIHKHRGQAPSLAAPGAEEPAPGNADEPAPGDADEPAPRDVGEAALRDEGEAPTEGDKPPPKSNAQASKLQVRSGGCSNRSRKLNLHTSWSSQGQLGPNRWWPAGVAYPTVWESFFVHRQHQRA